MKFNILVVPYRDAFFYKDYGPAVRDLQLLITLANLENVDEVVVANRPVSILEIILLRKKGKAVINHPKIRTINKISYDLFGPLKKRAWAADVYPGFISKLLESEKKENCKNILLDFLPIGCFDNKNLDGWVYWYDFIDNFVKHNRFTKNHVSLVEHKYNFVRQNANLVTAVTNDCLSLNGPYKTSATNVLSNKIFISGENENRGLKSNKFFGDSVTYDFGFIGFLTDKFDVDFVLELAEKYSIVLYGSSFDGTVSKRLANSSNITLKGKFSYFDISDICSTFKIGLLPYLANKSHDGSPLKLYEYIKYNLPCFTSIDYEISDSDFVVNYNSSKNLDLDIEKLLTISGSEKISKSIQSDWFLSAAINRIVSNFKESY